MLLGCPAWSRSSGSVELAAARLQLLAALPTELQERATRALTVFHLDTLRPVLLGGQPSPPAGALAWCWSGCRVRIRYREGRRDRAAPRPGSSRAAPGIPSRAAAPSTACRASPRSARSTRRSRGLAGFSSRRSGTNGCGRSSRAAPWGRGDGAGVGAGPPLPARRAEGAEDWERRRRLRYPRIRLSGAPGALGSTSRRSRPRSSGIASPRPAAELAESYARA